MQTSIAIPGRKIPILIPPHHPLYPMITPPVISIHIRYHPHHHPRRTAPHPRRGSATNNSIFCRFYPPRSKTQRGTRWVSEKNFWSPSSRTATPRKPRTNPGLRLHHRSIIPKPYLIISRPRPLLP